MSDAILFRRCLGLTDSKGIASQTMITNPRAKGAGSVEFTDCLNLTITPDGCVEKIAPLVAALDTGTAITELSAGSRLMFSDGINVKEWTGTNITNRFPAMIGAIAHTPIDVRVASAGLVYKSVHSSPVLQQALVGTYTGPPVSKPFYAMPAYKTAFVYNAKLYAVNAVDPRFLQYSEDYAYDLWALGDNSIGSISTVLQAGQIPGVLLTAHEGGVTAYLGTGPHDFIKKFYPCKFINGTLYSGSTTQVVGSSDGTPTTVAIYQHIFLCDDGVYTIGQDGALCNITDQQMLHISDLNSSYGCATILGSKYLVFGNLYSLEYDFQTKTLMKRTTVGVVGACIWNKKTYFAAGSRIATQGNESDISYDFGCSLTLPYSDLSASGTKSIEALYFTGTMNGEMIITATDQYGESWEHEVSDELVKVSDYRIKTPRRKLGNHISLKIECTSGAFRMEELRAVLSGSQRSR